MSHESNRVVVVGSGGRLGAAVVRVLRQHGHPVVAYDRRAMDLANPARIHDHLSCLNFDTLVNCAAMTSLDDCERHPSEATAVNATAPAQMAEICATKAAKMFQVSTDYVYDGSRDGLRCETDAINPLGVYAKTKHEAEKVVLAASHRNVVVRVSWIFGPDRLSFVDQFIEKAKSGAPLSAIADKFSTPTYSMDIASVLAGLMALRDVGGVYNVANRGGTDVSWFALAREVLKIATELGIGLKSHDVSPLKLAEMHGFVAARPIHTASSPAKLESLLKRPMRSWQAALREYLQQYHA